MVQHTIAILTCWHRSYPWYLPYFLHSSCYNPTIDFYTITDNQQPVLGKPKNIKIIYKTLRAIKETTTDKLGFAVNIKYAYKPKQLKR